MACKCFSKGFFWHWKKESVRSDYSACLREDGAKQNKTKQKMVISNYRHIFKSHLSKTLGIRAAHFCWHPGVSPRGGGAEGALAPFSVFCPLM
jgi:hypothetical protein